MESNEQTELTSKTETDSQTQRTDRWLPEGKGREDRVKKVKGLRSIGDRSPGHGPSPQSERPVGGEA